jgi:hypothetical protein
LWLPSPEQSACPGETDRSGGNPAIFPAAECERSEAHPTFQSRQE